MFLDDLGGLGTTRFAIAEALAKHRATPLSDQVEIETYTWDVLPAQFKSGDIVEYVERELTWVLEQLGERHDSCRSSAHAMAHHTSTAGGDACFRADA